MSELEDELPSPSEANIAAVDLHPIRPAAAAGPRNAA